MATNQSTKSNATPESDIATPAQLRAAVTDMDALAQDGFSSIEAVAVLALARLESPDCYRFLEHIAAALKLIKGTAQSGEDCINSRAEEVGCSHVDQHHRARHAALMAFRDEARAAA